MGFHATSIVWCFISIRATTLSNDTRPEKNFRLSRKKQSLKPGYSITTSERASLTQPMKPLSILADGNRTSHCDNPGTELTIMA